MRTDFRIDSAAAVVITPPTRASVSAAAAMVVMAVPSEPETVSPNEKVVVPP